jgi:hypothetical protein
MPSPWAWTSAVPSGGQWTFSHRHRVAIDAMTHAARKDMLALGEQAWVLPHDKSTPPGTARFEVHRTRQIPSADGLDGFEEADHVVLLRCAAAGVHALGAWRRRGLGWVHVAPHGAGDVTADEVRRLLAWQEMGR